MGKKYIISIDQSTQGTKALLFDDSGILLGRKDKEHRQIIDDNGWVSHNGEEIYSNTIKVVHDLIESSKINKRDVVGIGISNQRETSIVWDKKTGEPLSHAVVWQCSRAKEICEEIDIKNKANDIWKKTGLKLSPYFPAGKIAWILKNVEGAKAKSENEEVYYGTMDSWLIYKLTDGRSYKTDYSNASRTQLFNIFTLSWDKEICESFGININNLAEVCDSDSVFGETDLGGILDKPVPIHAILGDSHGALFGQGCLVEGMTKATYGTGSSVVMNIGKDPKLSKNGLVTSLAWKIKGEVNYILEGNINYTGAVISWMKDNVGLINSSNETEKLAFEAENDDELYFIPAFTGLGAPHWDSNAKGMLTGITRTTEKAEIVRAGVECIGYQIKDIVEAMEEDTSIEISELRVDGGPTKNKYLMQFQSDILNKKVLVPSSEELSGIGVAYLAGISLKLYDENILSAINREEYSSLMSEKTRNKKYSGWKVAIKNSLSGK